MKKVLLLAVMMIFASAVHVQAAEPTVLPNPDQSITVPAGYTNVGPDSNRSAGDPIDWRFNPETGEIESYQEKIATPHQDFYAYSAKLNTAMGYAGFEINPGDMGNDYVILYQHNSSSGENLNMRGFGTLDFEDPMFSPAGSTGAWFDGTWGAGIQGNGPVTVDGLLAYLQSFGEGVTVPVFNFNMNQEGKYPNDGIFLAGRVYLWNPLADGGKGAEVSGASWVFADGDFETETDVLDPTDAGWIRADGLLGIGPRNYDPTDKKYPFPFLYELEHNLGNSLDYLGYAPDMDLSEWKGLGYEFRAHFKMTGVNDGPDTLFLTGAYKPYNPPDNPPVVPEPMSMVLFGLGLVGAAIRKRRVMA